jgi:hypothetical protein
LDSRKFEEFSSATIAVLYDPAARRKSKIEVASGFCCKVVAAR